MICIKCMNYILKVVKCFNGVMVPVMWEVKVVLALNVV